MTSSSRKANRALVIILLPLAVIYAFIARLVMEIKDAFWFAWKDVQMEIESAKQKWNE